MIWEMEAVNGVYIKNAPPQFREWANVSIRERRPVIGNSGAMQ